MWSKKYSLYDRVNYHIKKAEKKPSYFGYSRGFLDGVFDDNGNCVKSDIKDKSYVNGVNAGLKARSSAWKIKF